MTEGAVKERVSCTNSMQNSCKNRFGRESLIYSTPIFTHLDCDF